MFEKMIMLALSQANRSLVSLVVITSVNHLHWGFNEQRIGQKALNHHYHLIHRRGKTALPSLHNCLLSPGQF